ncbi:unnamed protein product [Lampetra planeri]
MPRRAETARHALVVLHSADLRYSQPKGESRRTKHPVFTVTSIILITDGFEFMRREYGSGRSAGAFGSGVNRMAAASGSVDSPGA